MPEADIAPFKDTIPSREIQAITGYAQGMRESTMSSRFGYTTPSNMRTFIHRAYVKMRVPDMLGATKKLIESGEIDPMEIAKGHNLTAFNRLSPGELQVVDFVANFPAESSLKSADIEEAARRFKVGGLYPGKTNLDRIRHVTGTHNPAQLVTLYRAYQNLVSQGMDKDYTESDFPTSEDVESKVFYAKRIDQLRITDEDLVTLKMHMIGTFRSQANGEEQELRVTKGLVTKHRPITFYSIRRLHQAHMLDIDEYVDDRDLLRFKTVSPSELSDLESLVQSKPSTSLRETSYEELRKKFGVATNDHLAVLFYSYKTLYPTPKVESNKESLIEKVITRDQARIIFMSAQGMSRNEIRLKLGYKRRQFENIIEATGDALGLEKEMGEDKDTTLINAANLLMDSKDLDYKRIARDYDLAAFDKLLPSELSVLNQLARGEKSFKTMDGSDFTPLSIRRYLNQLHLKTGALSKTHLVVLYRAYLDQKSTPPPSKPSGIRITEEYIKSATLPEAVKKAGVSVSSRPIILDRIYKEKDVHSQSQLILKLVSEGSINLKELADEYGLINPDFKLSNFERLNARELQIAHLLSQGLSVSEIASALSRSFDNTTGSITQINRKLKTSHREQIAAFFLLYQSPNNTQEIAGNINNYKNLDVIGIQAARLRLRGFDEHEISHMLNISQERLNSHIDRLSVSLGTQGQIETIIELGRQGRIDISELTRKYRIVDFVSLNDDQIGMLETLLSKDPRRFLGYLEKMVFYLQQSPENITNALREIQLFVGLTPEGLQSFQESTLSEEPMQLEAIRPEPSTTNPSIAETPPPSPPSERQLRFGEEIYEPFIEKVFSYVDRRLQDHAESQEVVQEVFITAYNNIDSTNEQDFNALSWLYSIAQNRVRQSIDERRRMELVPHDPQIHDVSTTYDADSEPSGSATGVNFTQLKIEELALLYMEYRRRLRNDPQSLLTA